ncbi:Tripartite tricarboxylate transporter TctB family protein [Lentibacillus halodurans]|uniref:Tripartite tricarboxylate transporter TctB family protein n=1 Tax=Lentibacillus halodurans TaxID=237679 RepID=A0A1I0XK02_9BACI|nr:tripartite tricarboxylate transporter TctB family protein [Lentibacillus halodurans]SFB01449.1 Tripartite tricarboxylate transporter TctB family protein [Lentibacillus halodurans]
MTKSALSIAFSAGLFLVLIWMAWEAANFQELASYFPFYISLIAIVLIVVDLITQLRKVRKKEVDDKDEISKKETGAVIKYILWFVGYLLMMLLIGFLIGTSVFLLLFLLLETKLKLIKAVPITALTIAVILLLGRIMSLEWPSGMIGI